MEYSFVLRKDFGIYTMKCSSEVNGKRTRAIKNPVGMKFVLDGKKIKILEGWYIKGKTKHSITDDVDVWEMYPGMKEQLIIKAKMAKNNNEYIEIAHDLGYPNSVLTQLEQAKTPFQADLIMRTAREAM